MNSNNSQLSRPSSSPATRYHPFMGIQEGPNMYSYQRYHLQQQQQQQPPDATANQFPVIVQSGACQKRIKLAIFLKVLIRCLEKSNQTHLLYQTRLVILTCIRGHKMGDPTFASLDYSIEKNLRKMIDTNTWNRALSYTAYYLQRRHQKLSCSNLKPRHWNCMASQGNTTL